jgi:hypothetical protein
MNLMGSAQNREKFCCTNAARKNAKQRQIFTTPLRACLLSRGLMNLMGSAQNREKFCCTIAARKKCKTTTDF